MFILCEVGVHVSQSQSYY